ncbi:MAG TPA: hypothetical protein VFB20_16870 [Burkholderiales bacterium]|nr:hypothetical protein [Burkholderiales bacterium]
MPDAKQSNPEKGWSGIVSRSVSLVPVNIREAIGAWLGIWFFLLAPIVILAGVAIVYDTARTSTPEKPCWQLQQVGERVFKLNACTGEIVEIKLEPKAAAARPARK